MEAINIFPELITWKVNKNGLAPIAIRFDFNRKRAAYEQLPYRIKPCEWDTILKCVKSNCSDHLLMNQLIQNRLNKHRNFLLKRQTFNLPVSVELIKNYVKSGKGSDCFYQYAESVIESKKLKDGEGFGTDTKRRYRDEIKRLMQFKADLSFMQLNLNFLQEYKRWLQKTYIKKDGTHLHKNSIWKAFAFLRMIYNQAIKEEIVLPENNPFKQFEVGTFEQDIQKIKYLDLSDLDKIENVLKTKTEILHSLTIHIGWRFLAMCVSGIRISDAMMLDDMMFNDAGDLELIPYKTRRHGNKAHIPIVSERQRRYITNTLQFTLPKKDAKIFRNVFNDHLKIICALAGIKSVTSHAGRHTMGSFLVDAGVQEKAAMAMLGIKSDKVIKTYLHLKESKLITEANKLNKVF